MPPRAARTPPTLLLHAVAPEQQLEGFRTVKVPLGHVDLALSLRSHAEEGLAPRYQQTEHAALHTAVSFWRRKETAHALAKRFPKHGSYVARVVLTHGKGFDYLDQTAERDPDHLTIWGSSLALAGAVVDTVPVGT